MDNKELELIMKEGESYKIEFKENMNGLDKEIVAFANSSGGRVFLGMDDHGNIKGIKMTNRRRSQIQDIANNCEPKIKISLEEFQDVIIITVYEGGDKPYECCGGFYKRIGANSQKLSRDEIMELFKSEGKARFDEFIETRFNYPEDFDESRFKRFLQLAEISESDDTDKMLVSLGVAEKQENKLVFNNAGVLFFSKEPQRFVPWSVFTVALFKDDAGVEIIDRKEVKGSLFEIVEEVMKFVKLYSKVAYRFTGKPRRDNIYEYPFDAIREAVINSVMHKYYFEHGHNNILKFLPDRIRIENYWLEPQNFVLGKTVFRRNQQIADLFSRIHFGERMGTGFERIKEMCKKENAPSPEVEYDENYFYVTFKQSREYLKLAEKGSEGKVTETVEKTVEKTLSAMKENPHITQKELEELTGLSRSGVEWNIKKLKEEGIIKRVGPDKGGHWKVIE